MAGEIFGQGENDIVFTPSQLCRRMTESEALLFLFFCSGEIVLQRFKVVAKPTGPPKKKTRRFAVPR
jgi:hypothetical protein